MVINPENVFQILANRELIQESQYQQAVQIKPQHVSLKVRISKYSKSKLQTRINVNLIVIKQINQIIDYFIVLISDEAHNLDFYYEQAQDYPVDLYYLMDLSKSMEDDKEKLSALG